MITENFPTVQEIHFQSKFKKKKKKEGRGLWHLFWKDVRKEYLWKIDYIWQLTEFFFLLRLNQWRSLHFKEKKSSKILKKKDLKIYIL